MVATALDLSQIKTDALSSAATFRSLIELGSTDTPTFKGSTLTGGTVTASTPVIDASQTWNDAAVTFTGMKLDVTDTASAGDSKLMDLQVGGTSKARINKDGTFHAYGIETYATYGRLGIRAFASGNRLFHWDFFGFGGINIPLKLWNGAQAQPVYLYRDAADTFAQRRDTNAQEYRLYNTWTSPGTSYERAFLKWDANTFKIGTEAAGTGTARTLTIENVAKINGSTSSAADPSTTEYPNDGDHGIHKNTTSGNVFLAYNDGGSSIVKVQLS